MRFSGNIDDGPRKSSFHFGDFDPSEEQSHGALIIKLPVLYTYIYGSTSLYVGK